MNLRHIRQSQGFLPSLHLLLLFSGTPTIAFTPEARWAQATVVTNDALFVYGGKTDPFNSYSYTSAPNNNELLYLPLSQPFEAASPPWQLLNGSSSSSTFQGPVLAWHTLSAFNTSCTLLFGGEPDPNSQPPTLDNADSAILLDLSSLSQPAWYPQATSWGGQPIRRIHHASATAPSGVVYITGGQKADGSGTGFSDHYAFNPQTLTFSQLPTENAPPAIYGHTSVMSMDGTLVVFGGASQGSLLPLSMIWVLGTSGDIPVWSQLQVNTGSLPPPRRAFAATAVGQGIILIQGGSDAGLQNNLDDGWTLDTSQSPAVWAPIEQLTQIGPRRDHYAVYSNGFVMFGFGYLNSGPAPADLQIFDLSSNTFISSYTPPLPTASTTRMTPGESGIPTRTVTNHHGSSASFSGTANPTGTVSLSNDGHKTKPVVAIAVGTTLGALGAVAIGVMIVLYSHKQQGRSNESFLIIDDDENDGSLYAGSVIPAATMYSGHGAPGTSRWGDGLRGAAFGIAGTLSAMAKSRNARDTYQRRDMLADEDTRDFGEWYNTRRRDGTGGSSFSLASILGARFRSREPSTYSRGSGGHRPEKTDPFSDGVSLMHHQESGTPGIEGGRPHNRRETSYLSTSSYSYLDPFADPVDEKGDTHDTHEYEPTSSTNAVSRPPPLLSTIRMVPPVSTSGHPLSPLSEHTSNTSLPSNDRTSSFADFSETPAETVTSHTTLQPTNEPSPLTLVNKSLAEAPRTVTSFPSTIVPASVPLTNVRRSDSWWSKFYRTSFLDRGSTLRSPARSEFLDPNPPPSLDPISESLPRASADEFPAEQKGCDQPLAPRNKLYKADPGNSMTSLQTADTERIERMAGAMDVAQRLRVRSQRTTRSVSSGLSADTHQASQDDDVVGVEFGAIPLAESESPCADDLSGTLVPYASPSPQHTPLLPPALEQKPPPKPSWPPTLPDKTSDTSEMVPPSSPHGGLTNPVSCPSVAARVRMYERKSSQDQEQVLVTNTRRREERSPKKSRVSVDYGFVPRPNLFVANPDHRNSRSSDS